MRNKKTYNNLFDGIMTTLAFLLTLSLYLFLSIVPVLHPNGQNLFYLHLANNILCGGGTILLGFCIIKYCYAYWILTDDSIIFKNLYSKRKEIKIAEIEKVEKKTVSEHCVGFYPEEAYFIYSHTTTIMIIIGNKKSYPELDKVLEKFINSSESE